MQDISTDDDEHESVVEVVFRLKVKEGFDLRQVAKDMQYSFTHRAINDAYIVDIVTEG